MAKGQLRATVEKTPKETLVLENVAEPGMAASRVPESPALNRTGSSADVSTDSLRGSFISDDILNYEPPSTAEGCAKQRSSFGASGGLPPLSPPLARSARRRRGIVHSIFIKQCFEIRCLSPFDSLHENDIRA